MKLYPTISGIQHLSEYFHFSQPNKFFALMRNSNKVSVDVQTLGSLTTLLQNQLDRFVLLYLAYFLPRISMFILLVLPLFLDPTVKQAYCIILETITGFFLKY